MNVNRVGDFSRVRQCWNMKPGGRKKLLRLTLLLTACAIAAVLLFALIKHQFFDSEKTKEAISPTRTQSSDRSMIRGLRYSVNMSEETRLFIEADEFRVGKKKLGFLRVSLLNEAEIRNARIRIVKTPTQSPPQGRGVPDRSPSQINPEQAHPPSSGNAQGREGLLMDSARAVLNEKAFPGMSSTRIVSIKIAPIEFQILEGNASLLKISAGQAGFDLKNRSIVFRDRVRASAGKESWIGDELTIDPASGKVTGRRKGGAAAL
jgi:hypothetical protein